MSVIELTPEVEIMPERIFTNPVVQEEAERLDRLFPGWADRVDTETLDLGSCTRCVLGQATGDWGVSFDQVRDDGYTHNGYYAMKAYTESWIVEIKKRQEA